MENVGEKVTIAGWVNSVRNLGGVTFVTIRDHFGVTQVILDGQEAPARESVVSITGEVLERISKNPKMPTGDIEIKVEKMEILGACNKVLPFEIADAENTREDLRLRYRYLDLRNPANHERIVLRSKLMQYVRNYMHNHDFLEVQTPILTASSPEGARDFIVPSRKFHGKFYALPQAPQQFKQLLMCGGIDKYFQIAPCFRDEDARSDRVYGEFYQLDLEMAFATEEDVLEVGEKVFYETFKEFAPTKKLSEKPFVRLSYKESMERFGTDKPDLRNPLELIDLTDVFEETTFRPFRGVTVKGIVVEDIASKSNSWFNELVEYAESIGMPGIGYFKVLEDMSFAGPIDKFLSEEEREDLIDVAKLKPESVIFFIADRKHAYKYASLIRDELGRKLDLIDKDEFKFCIVKDFPMYEWSEEEDQYIFTHNPFSMPQGGMDALTSKKPEDRWRNGHGYQGQMFEKAI